MTAVNRAPLKEGVATVVIVGRTTIDRAEELKKPLLEALDRYDDLLLELGGGRGRL